MSSITTTEVVIWDIMRLGDFEKYVFSLFFLAENKKCMCSIKCHMKNTSIYLIFKKKKKLIIYVSDFGL